MTLSGSQKDQLIEAFLSAYPRHAGLKRMVHSVLSKNIEELTPINATLDECLFELVSWAEAQGELKELLLGAWERNKKNPELARCCLDFGLHTSEYSQELPALKDFGEVPSRPDGALCTHKDVELIALPSDFYREEFFISLSDARGWGISEKDLYALLSIESLSLDKALQKVAVHLLVDERVMPGTVQVNQPFAESTGILAHEGRSWSLSRTKNVVLLKEIVLKFMVESGDVEAEVAEMRNNREKLFCQRPLWVERTDSLHTLSLPIKSHAYFTVYDLQPALQELKPETLLLLNEKTILLLLVPHRKSAVDMVLLVDVSSSMTVRDYMGADNALHSRLDGVYVALRALIQRRLVSGSRVSRLAIVVFGKNPAMLSPSQPEMLELNGIEKIQQIHQDIATRLNDFGLRVLKVDGRGTNIAMALSYAARLFDAWEETEKVLVLLSDGAHWTRKMDDDMYAGEIERSADDPVALADSLHFRRGIHIHTVAISSEEAYRLHVDPRYGLPGSASNASNFAPNVPLLRDISSSSDGIFFESPDAKSLNRLFGEIGLGSIYSLM